jgi:hypothetical protein
MNATPDELSRLITMLLGQGPFYVIWLVGLVVALVNWSKCPRPALLTVLALVLMFVASAANVFFWYAITSAGGLGGPDVAFKLSAVNWGFNFVRAVAYGLLFWAVFGWRRAVAPVRRRDDWDDEDDRADDRPAPKASADSDPNIRTSPKGDRD